MDAKEAVAIAKRYVMELFGDEGVSHLGLEGIDQQGTAWQVTLGFSRPWDVSTNAFSVISGRPATSRIFKRVTISGDDGRLFSIEHREQKDA